MHLSPPWLEIAGIALIAAITAPYIIIRQEILLRKILRLHHTSVPAPQVYALMHRWLGLWAGAVVVAAPLWEEVVFRSLTVYLVQLGYTWQGLAAGFLLNIPFAMVHAANKKGIHQLLYKLRIYFYGSIYVLVAASGLLSIGILMHALWNYIVNGRNFLRIRRTMRLDSFPPGRDLEFNFRKHHSTIHIEP